MLFSVIIPTYNRLAYLPSTLKSVWAQTFRDFEVIVVDDGSQDDIKSVVATTAGSARFLRQQNAGPGAARNRGVAKAVGDYLAFLDSDDLWFPWTLATYAEVVRATDSPAFVAGKPYHFKDDAELSAIVQEPTRTLMFADYLTSGDEMRWWGASSFVIRRDEFVAVKGFTDKWVNAEDADLALRLGVARGFAQITRPVTFAYRKHAASATKDLKRSCAGMWSMICAEQEQQYPGGRLRALERRRILTRHTRPVTLGCLRQGLQREAWRMYRDTFAWNALQGRGKYLLAFPILAVIPHFARDQHAG